MDRKLDRLFHGPNWLPLGFRTLANLIEREPYAGLEIRNRLQDALGNTLQAKKETSEILHKAGFVGMKYDGYFDGPCAVIFSDDDIKIVDHLKFSKGRRIKLSKEEDAALRGHANSKKQRHPVDFGYSANNFYFYENPHYEGLMHSVRGKFA